MLNITSLKISNITTIKDLTVNFINNECVLISGNNLDDSSQKSNGSGKSSFIECIAVCLTGKPIRDINTKDIVSHDKDYGFVELTLEHHRETIIIKRTISIKKSQTCEILINNVPKVLSDINGYNAFILSYLEVTSEELFNFYLISSDAYRPFLTIPDASKKEIINRFSGASKLDVVSDNLDKNITDNKEIILNYEKIVIRQQAFVSQKEEQLKIALEYNSDDEINIIKFNIQEKKNKLREINVDIKEINKNKNDAVFSLEDNEKLVQSLFKNLNESKASVREIESLIRELKSQRTEKNNEIKTIILENNKKINNLNYKIKEAKLELSHAVNCPNCKHAFVVDSTKTIDETNKLIEECTKEIASLEIYKINESNKNDLECVELLENINECDSIYEEEQEKLNNIKKENDDLAKKISGFETKIQISENSIKSLNNLKLEINKFIDSSDQIIQNEINKKHQNIKKCNELLETEIQELKIQTSNLKTEQEKLQHLTSWLLNFKGFKSYVANLSIKHVQDYTNYFLNLMGSNLSIEIEGYKELSNKKLKEQITTNVFKDGHDIGSYGKLSKGEKARIEICLIIAMQELLNSKSKGLNLLIVDEILSGVDYEGMHSIINALNKLKKTIMIITQLDLDYRPSYIFEKSKGITTLTIKE